MRICCVHVELNINLGFLLLKPLSVFYFRLPMIEAKKLFVLRNDVFLLAINFFCCGQQIKNFLLMEQNFSKF